MHDQPGDVSDAERLGTLAVSERRLPAAFHDGGGERVVVFCHGFCGERTRPDLAAVVAWVPDASTDPFMPSPGGVMEEGGQRVRDRYWREAHDAGVVQAFARVASPCHLVFGTEDEYVSEVNRTALTSRARPHDVVEVLDGYPHSAWTAQQAAGVIERSVRHLRQHL